MSLDIEQRAESVTDEITMNWPGRLKAGMAAVAALGALSATTGEYYARDPFAGPEYVADVLYDQGPAAVPTETQQKIDRSALQPTGQGLIDYEHWLTVSSDAVHDNDPQAGREHRQDIADHYFRFCSEQASINGLELSDARGYARQAEKATSAGQLLGIMQAYGRTIGLKFELPSTTDLLDIDQSITPLAPNQRVITPQTRTGVADLLLSLSLVPKQIYEYAAIREVRFVDTLPEMQNPIFGKDQMDGHTNMVTGIIYLPWSYLGSPDLSVGGLQSRPILFMHELAHLLDYRMSGDSVIGAKRDKLYTSLNADGYEYGDPAQPIAQNIVSRQNYYGATNVLEDKAVMMSLMLPRMDTDVLDQDKVIENKRLMLLGRLEEAVPGFGFYLLGVSPHEADFYRQVSKR